MNLPNCLTLEPRNPPSIPNHSTHHPKMSRSPEKAPIALRHSHVLNKPLGHRQMANNNEMKTKQIS